MGNSRTGRYADGYELYHPEAPLNRWLRSLASHRSPSRPQGLRDAIVALARRAPPTSWRRARGAVLRHPATARVSPRRATGEVARLLLDPDVSARLHRLGRRHRWDVGDVAALWAASLVGPPAIDRLSAPGAEAEPA